jgi:hypothetical protein
MLTGNKIFFAKLAELFVLRIVQIWCLQAYKHKHSAWIGKIIRNVGKLQNQYLTAANDRAHNGLSFELLKVKSRCLLMEI